MLLEMPLTVDRIREEQADRQSVSKRLRGRPDLEHNLADVAICLQIMYDITDEELGEWVEGKTVRQQRRMEDDK